MKKKLRKKIVKLQSLKVELIKLRDKAVNNNPYNVAVIAEHTKDILSIDKSINAIQGK